MRLQSAVMLAIRKAGMLISCLRYSSLVFVAFLVDFVCGDGKTALGTGVHAQAAALAPVGAEGYSCHFISSSKFPSFGKVGQNIFPAVAGGKRG